MDLETLLYKELPPTFTDFAGNQRAFHEAFVRNAELGTPIKDVLELGVCRINRDFMSPDVYGQSTKTLNVLCEFFNSTELISIDIDEKARETVEHCKKWLKDRGWGFREHNFICSNSIEFDVKFHLPDGVDFIFLDTNHDDNYPERLGIKGETGGAGMTYKEICYYAPHLTENGRLFMHDTMHFYHPKAYGVNTEGAVRRFLDENPGFKFREHGLNQHGLGEIVRKDSKVW
jgi:hypothetical protein